MTAGRERWSVSSLGPAPFTYVCRRCEVYGSCPPDADPRCWACERADRLDRR
jgi:hypothetical protein